MVGQVIRAGYAPTGLRREASAGGRRLSDAPRHTARFFVPQNDKRKRRPSGEGRRLFERASQESLPGLSCDEPKREGLGPIHKTAGGVLCYTLGEEVVLGVR